MFHELCGELEGQPLSGNRLVHPEVRRQVGGKAIVFEAGRGLGGRGARMQEAERGQFRARGAWARGALGCVFQGSLWAVLEGFEEELEAGHKGFGLVRAL